MKLMEMLPKIFGFFFLLAAFSSSIAEASSPSIGADIAVAVAQKMLAAPPLPSLEGEGLTIAPQYGYVEVRASSAYEVVGGMYSFDGKTSGNTGGLSISYSNKAGFGFFIFGTMSKVHGNVQSYVGGEPSFAVREIEAGSVAGAAGLSYRLLGSEKSVLAAGLFAGPAMIEAKSTAKYEDISAGGGASTKFTFNPEMRGLYTGLQTSLRLGNFRINPYAVIFTSSSPICQEVKGEPGGTIPIESFECEGEKGKLHSFATFPAVGLFLGYKSFRINVYSSAVTAPYLTVTSYSGTFGVNF